MSDILVPSDREGGTDISDEDEVCLPPTTFCVDVSKPQESIEKTWFHYQSDLPLVPGLPFHPIGSTAVCGLCRLRRRTFYCEDCIRKGDFVHSNLRKPESLSEKQLNELHFEQKIKSLKSKIEERTSARQKALLLSEEIKAVKQRIKYLKHLIDIEKPKLAKTIDNRTKLYKVNVKRQQRLPLFASKVEKISSCVQKFVGNLELEKSSAAHKLKELTVERCKFADQIISQIFPIYVESCQGLDDFATSHNLEQIAEDISDAMGTSGNSEKSMLQSYINSCQQDSLQYSGEFENSQELMEVSSTETVVNDIEEEISDAMGTSFVQGRWISQIHSRIHPENGNHYRIVSAVMCSGDESLLFPVLTDKTSDEHTRIQMHNVYAYLTFSSHLLSHLSSCFDTVLPKKLTFAEFGAPAKSEFKFYQLVSRLNLNVLYLCLAQGLNVNELKPRQALHNLNTLTEHLQTGDSSLLGFHGRPISDPEKLHSMSKDICSELELFGESYDTDSDCESENGELKDWEAVAPGSVQQEGYALSQSPSVLSIPQITASTIMTSFFRGWTGNST